jgi:hypothetical protein
MNSVSELNNAPNYLRRIKCIAQYRLWIVPRSSEKSGRFRRTHRLHLQGRESHAPAGYFLVYSWTLRMEAICSSEMSGCLRTTRRYQPTRQYSADSPLWEPQIQHSNYSNLVYTVRMKVDLPVEVVKTFLPLGHSYSCINSRVSGLRRP